MSEQMDSVEKLNIEIQKATDIVNSIPKINGLKQWMVYKDRTFEIIRIWLGVENTIAKYIFATKIGMNISSLNEWIRKYQYAEKKNLQNIQCPVRPSTSQASSVDAGKNISYIEKITQNGDIILKHVTYETIKYGTPEHSELSQKMSLMYAATKK